MKIERMKWLLLISASFIAGTLVPTGLTQSTTTSQRPVSTQYLHVDYIKVDPAKTQQYLSIEHDVWKPMFQRSYNAGKLKQWSIYEVKDLPGEQAQGGTKKDYNFIALRAYNKIEDLENPLAREDFEKIHPGQNPMTIINQAEAVRSVVRSEMFVLADQIK